MAQGEVVFFDQFLVNALDANIGHNFGPGNTTIIKCAVVDSTTTPTTATPIPTWGAAGTTNFSTWEVTEAGDYTAGGNQCTTPLVTLNGGLAEVDWNNPTAWVTGTDADAKWGIFYDESTTDNHCIGYVDLGPAFDMSSGTLTITLGTPVATLNQAAP
jgi:hypothetical protein